MLLDQAQELRALVEKSKAQSAAADGRSAAVAEPGPARRARVIAIASGKGGVGKSNVCVNLAIRLSQMGRRVVLLDADLGTANADVLCNLPPGRNLAHVVAGRQTLQDAIVEAPGGFRLVPGASGLANMAALSEFERRRLVDQLQQLDDNADLVLIDTGAGVSPNVLTFLGSADQQLIVATPEPTAITDAYAVIKTLCRKADRQRIDVTVLVNMARSEREARKVFDRLDAVCRRFLKVEPRYAGHLLHDPHVGNAVRRRLPFVLSAPQCDAAEGIGHLAHRLDRHARERRASGLIHRLTSWLAS